MKQSANKIRILNAGDSAFTIEFGNKISTNINKRIRGFVLALERAQTEGLFPSVTEWVPTFRSVTVYFTVSKTSHKKLRNRLLILAKTARSVDSGKKKVHHVPVCYDAAFAPDIENVSAHTGFSREKIIELHTKNECLIYMLGFLPGFVYLGGMDARLATPRLASPRLKIEPGSVGIAESQTGIYPLASPGGWQLIGKTPIKLYDPERTPPVLFKAGDYIKFDSISYNDYCILSKNNKSSSDKSIKKTVKKTENFVTIIDAGALTTVQDIGRVGYQKDGFTVSGAMDVLSCRLANIIAGNAVDAAVLETTMIGPSLRFEQDTIFVITGANQQPQLNGQSIPLYTQVYAQKASVLTLSSCSLGLRTYIAFAGGIDVPKKLKSRSTSLRYKLGGYLGRKIEKNDILPLFSKNIKTVPRYPALPVPAKLYPIAFTDSKFKNSSVQILRVTEGPQIDCLSKKELQKLITNEYVISGESDRMGLRLKGMAIKTLHGSDIISDAIANGSVQIPSSGEPIIMAADRQTVGGYIKPVVVITADIPKLGQLQPGSKVRFSFVSVKTAVKLLKKQQICLNTYESLLKKNKKEDAKYE